MNLMDLFNIDYLKENVKKSKGAIILFSILVPLFTALVTVFIVRNEKTMAVPVPETVSLINLIGMYFVPLTISFLLFGYVYKKKSVDFVNSMPLNRKSIFVTNTIGGIIIITLIQLLTAMILLICNRVFSDLVIYPQMIFDIFILMWVSYVFVFFVSNMAMSVSGTFLTQIAVTMLMLFLIPFCMDTLHGFQTDRYLLTDSQDEIIESLGVVESNYTMPYRIFDLILTGNIGDSNLYSQKSILRMVVLSIIYFIIGLKLFEKRKMENNEESFAKENVHLIVKALTMVPMVVVLEYISNNEVISIMLLAMIAVYYFVYDFIVRKRIKFLKSAVCFLVSLLVLYGISYGVHKLNDDSVFDTKIPTTQINSIAVTEYSEWNKKTFYANRVYMDEYFIDDENFINLVINGLKSETQFNDGLLKVIIKLKNGQKYNVSTYSIDSGKLNEILQYLNNDEKYVKIAKEKALERGVLTTSGALFTDEETDMIYKEVEKELEKSSMTNSITKFSSRRGSKSIMSTFYRNHKLQQNVIPMDLTNNVFEISTKAMNRNAKQIVEKYFETENSYASLTVDEIVGYETIEDEDEYYMLGYTNEKAMEFIEKYADEVVDLNKPYAVISGSIRMAKSNYIYFYTNRIDEILEFMHTEKQYQEDNDNNFQNIDDLEVENFVY